MAIVSKLSPLSVDKSVQRLTSLAASRGLKVFAVIDHGGEAAAVRLPLRETPHQPHWQRGTG